MMRSALSRSCCPRLARYSATQPSALLRRDSNEVSTLSSNSRSEDDRLMASARLRTELVDWRQATETLRAAIRATALDGKYNEAAIRKAVSFELAELIVAERNRALEDKT
jgi:hypothetical protein